MKMDAKTLAVVGSLITALGGATTAVIQAVRSNDNNEALFRSYRIEIAVLKAKVGVLMKRSNVVLDVDLEEIIRSVDGPGTKSGTWSPFPSAMAQSLPDQVLPMVSRRIGDCDCVCPDEVMAAEAPPLPVPDDQQADQELFRRTLRDQLRRSPKSLDELKVRGPTVD